MRKRSRLILILTLVLVLALCMSTVIVSAASVRGARKYRAACGKVAEATSNERNRVVGGKKGDQTGNEVKISKYDKSYKWKFVIRATDPSVANGAADFLTKVCRNNNIGYNNYVNRQKGIDQRDSLYNAARKANWDPYKIKTKVDTSCTPMCMVAFEAAGIDMSPKLRARYRCRQTGTYTGIYRARTVNAESLETAVRLVNKTYVRNGKRAPFRIIKLSKRQFKQYKKYLKRGDVICTYHHTVMVM